MGLFISFSCKHSVQTAGQEPVFDAHAHTHTQRQWTLGDKPDPPGFLQPLCLCLSGWRVERLQPLQEAKREKRKKTKKRREKKKREVDRRCDLSFLYRSAARHDKVCHRKQAFLSSNLCFVLFRSRHMTGGGASHFRYHLRERR